MRITRRVFRLVQRLASSRGLTLLPTWRVERLRQSEYLRRLFRDYRISAVIDVGANDGQFVSFLRDEVGFASRILSVEPIPALASGLRARADAHWTVVECALGSASGSSPFFVTAGTEFSSLRVPRADAQPLFDGQADVVSTIDVRVRMLDDLIDEYAGVLGDRMYLKLDTQGFDLEVLRGLSRHAHRVVALQSEASVHPIYERSPHFAQTISDIEARGFFVSEFFPNNDGHYPRLIEFDCHFVRADVALHAH